MPQKVGFLTISATPQQPSSTNELWGNADFIKNRLIPKLLTIHEHLIITIADGTLQAHNFEAFYPLEGYSDLQREDAINKANAVGQVIYMDLLQAIQSNPLLQSRITVLRWDDVNLEEEKLLVSKKIDSENDDYDSELVESIETVVEARVTFLSKKTGTLDEEHKEKIRKQSTLYFRDEVAHAYRILKGITLSINNESDVYQPEAVWYPGVVPNIHPIPYVFRVGGISIFHRINLQEDLDKVISKVARKLEGARGDEWQVGYISIIGKSQTANNYVHELMAEIMKKNKENTGSRESVILTQNVNLVLTQFIEQLGLIKAQAEVVASSSKASPSAVVITSKKGMSATVNTGLASNESLINANQSETTNRLSNLPATANFS